MKTDNSFFSPKRLVFMTPPRPKAAPGADAAETAGDNKPKDKVDFMDDQTRINLMGQAQGAINDRAGTNFSKTPDGKALQRAMSTAAQAELSLTARGRSKSVQAAKDLHAALAKISDGAAKKVSKGPSATDKRNEANLRKAVARAEAGGKPKKVAAKPADKAAAGRAEVRQARTENMTPAQKKNENRNRLMQAYADKPFSETVTFTDVDGKKRVYSVTGADTGQPVFHDRTASMRQAKEDTGRSGRGRS